MRSIAHNASGDNPPKCSADYGHGHDERTELAQSFLEDVLHLDDAPAWQRYYLWVRPDGRDGESVRCSADELYRSVRMAVRNRGDVFYRPHAFAARGGQRTGAIVQVGSLVIDHDGLDADAASELLTERTGLTAHWPVRTSPDHSQLVLKMKPERLGKRNRDAVVNRVQRIMRDLYELIDADPNAAAVNQPFRLPGSERMTAHGVWTVSAERSDHAAYSLNQIEASVTKAARHGKQSRQTQRQSYRGYNVSRHSKPSGKVWDCAAIQWIRSRTIAVHSRDAAAVALAIAGTLDGLDESDARQRIIDWHAGGGTESGRGNDGKPYTARQVSNTVRSIYRHVSQHKPLGLDPERLTQIEDTSGQTMPTAVAQTVFNAMPNTRPDHKPRPLDQLKNKPFILRLTDYLDGLAQQAKATGTPELTLTARQAEAWTGVSRAAIANRIHPNLKRIGVASTVTTPYGTRTTVDLRRLTPARVHRMITFVRPPQDAQHERNLLKYLWRRFGSVLSRLWALLKSLASWVRSLGRSERPAITPEPFPVTMPVRVRCRSPDRLSPILSVR